MVKHLELAKFIEKLVLFVIFKTFWPDIHHYGFQNSKILAEIFSLRLHQIGSIV